MLKSSYENITGNIPVNVAVFKLIKECWLTEHNKVKVGDELFVLYGGYLDKDTMYHKETKSNFHRPALSCIEFVEYRCTKDMFV